MKEEWFVMTDAVIYARVSSKEQSEGFSIDAQLRLLREYADKNEFDVIQEFLEVETAKQAGRPVFREMLGLINSNTNCKTILVEKTDRLYRNIKDWVTIDDLAIDIHFVKEGMVIGPAAKSSDKFFHGIRVLMAKNYVDNLAEEIKKGMVEKVLAGGWPHRAPFGYDNVKGIPSVQPHPEKGEAMRWAYYRFAAADISVRELHREFKRRFKQSLVCSTFTERLRDPFYKGQMFWKGKTYPSNHAPLVDEQTWQRVQVILDTGSKPAVKDISGTITYRGLITCGHCGCAIVGEIKKGKYVYYHCTQNKGPCKENGWVRQEIIDNQFLESLSTMKLPVDFHDGVIEAIRHMHSVKIREHQDVTTSLIAKARTVQDNIVEMYRDKLDGTIPSKMWREEHKSMSSDLHTIHGEIRAHKEAFLGFYDMAELVIDFTEMAERIFLEGDTDARRQVINLVYSNSTLCSGTLMNTTKKPFDLAAEGFEGEGFGAYRARTGDLLRARQALSQLS